MHRKYLSGNAKRKLKLEKEKRLEQLMNKIPKLTSERFHKKENTKNQSFASTSDTNVENAATAEESECPLRCFCFENIEKCLCPS